MMIDIALEIATCAHKGQTDKAGLDYIQHPIYVASLVTTEKEKAIALLHDVIEDSDYTAQDLLDAGIPQDVVTAVKILTKKPGVPYGDYLSEVKSNELARVVKIADLTHNSDLSRLQTIAPADRERQNKYKVALLKLSVE